MMKKFPDLLSDADAERLVETPDLSDYDWSDMVPVRFELGKKDSSVHLRLPGKLLDEVRSHARRAGMPTQRFIRLALERAVGEPKPR